MKEFYIEAITRNLNVLNEHFLKCVLAFTRGLVKNTKGDVR